MALGDKETIEESDGNVHHRTLSSDDEKLESPVSNSSLWDAMNLSPGDLPEVFSDSEESAMSGDNTQKNATNDLNEFTSLDVEDSSETLEPSEDNPSTTDSNSNMTLESDPVLNDFEVLSLDDTNSENQTTFHIPAIVITGPGSPSNSYTEIQPDEHENDEEDRGVELSAEEACFSSSSHRNRREWWRPSSRIQLRNFRCDDLPDYRYKFGNKNPGSCRNYVYHYFENNSLFNGDGRRIRNNAEVPRPERVFDFPKIQVVSAPNDQPFDMFADPYRWMRIPLCNRQGLSIQWLNTSQVIVLSLLRCVELYLTNGYRPEIDLLDVLINYGYVGFVQFLESNTVDGALTIDLDTLDLYHTTFQDEDLD